VDDFDLFLEEVGVSRELMLSTMEKMPPPLPRDSSEKYYLASSPVHGTGVYASENVDGFIGRLWEDNYWYEAGRFLNHSPTPNCRPLLVEGVMILIGEANQDEELLVNYRDIREVLSD